MCQQMVVGDIEIQVEKKKIKNMYIRIVPPDGQVKMTVPKQMTDEAIRRFALSKMEWILHHKQRFINAEIEEPCQYVSGEQHYVWGRPYRLQVIELEGGLKKSLRIEGDDLIMTVPKGSSAQLREAVMLEWYRQQLRLAIPEAMARCVNIVGKTPNEWRIKNMKTRWGTCNTVDKRIWLNLQLAKKAPECLDYVITHELVHLYVRGHNAQFKAYMDQFYPEWKSVKKELNRR